MKLKTFRKLLKLGVDRGNPFTEEHEWMYRLINSYNNIDKDLVYSLFNETSDMIAIRQEFMITILTNTEKYYDIKKFKDIHASIQDVIDLWRKDPTGEYQSAAWSAARSAAWSAAESAAWSAAAWSAAAWSAARSAAESAADAWSAEKEQQHLIMLIIRKHTK